MNFENILISLESELKLLNEIIFSPEKFINDQELIFALKSQKNFANYENKDLKIIFYSLNSHKKYIKNSKIYDYDFVNNLRLEAYNLVQKSKASSLEDEKNPPNFEIINLKKHNILLTGIIMKLKYRLEYYAKVSNKKELLADLKQQNKEIESLLSIIEQ